MRGVPGPWQGIDEPSLNGARFVRAGIQIDDL